MKLFILALRFGKVMLWYKSRGIIFGCYCSFSNEESPVMGGKSRESGRLDYTNLNDVFCCLVDVLS
jgi:hypothetical protein